MSRIRVFHFVEAGDTSGFFPQLARWYDSDRFEMTVGTLYEMTPDLRQGLESEGVHTWSSGAQGRRDLPAVAYRLRRRLAQGEQIVHTHLFEPSLVGLAVGRTMRLPTVSTRHHSNYHARMQKRVHVQLDRLATRMSDVVIAVSTHTAEVMIEDEGAPPAKIVTIPNGIDTERITVSDNVTLEALRASLDGGDPALRLVLHPARFHPEKGHFELFEAIARLVREGEPPVRLLLAGEGPARTQYEERVRALGIDSHVEFLGFRRDIHDLMSVADVVVLPSLAEAFGLALLEALYLGAPVVASDIGGMPEIVETVGRGRLVPPADPAALAAAITAEIDAGRPTLDRDATDALFDAHYSFRSMMRRYEEVYDSLVARP